MTAADLASDHVDIRDALAARRYFGLFETIIAHLGRVAGTMHEEGTLSRPEAKVLGAYVQALARTFRALGTKYLLTGRDGGTSVGTLTMDVHESGFPVFQELMTMANDAQQAARHLAGLPSAAALKDEMIRMIVGELRPPARLQFALSQRLYYETLAEGGLFWARNDPVATWEGEAGARRRFLVHWAVYDSTQNLPMIYLMELEDSGRTTLPQDTRRWPVAQAHLMAQSVAALKLVTIATGFDRDFDDLHPKRLRRFRLGPMHAAAWTQQSGPLSEVLAEAAGDWALVWTAEELVSERAEPVKSGWFGTVERQIWRLDGFAGRGAETGASRTDRAVILPERPYQVLAERNPPGFAEVRKYVVSPGGRVYVAR